VGLETGYFIVVHGSVTFFLRLLGTYNSTGSKCLCVMTEGPVGIAYILEE